MEFRILGPLEVIHGGRAVPVGGARERAVLALLLASPNRVVSAERLADELWGGAPPERAAHSLQVFVSRLRKALREAGGDAIVVTRPPGYVVEIPPERLDAARFEALVTTAHHQADRGAAAEAAATLRTALGLWRGPALADVPDAPMGRAEAARLEDARLGAIEARIDADLACGRHAELTAELDALTREHPLREGLWGQRMMALYRSGRQVEALRAFRDLRRFLAEEVGLEPSPTVSALEASILQQTPDLDWQPQARPAVPPPAAQPARVPERAITQPPGTLPPELQSLAGGPVTIVFTDVEASTDLRTRHGDEAAQQLLKEHESIVRAQVQEHGGLEVKALGDGFMLAFGSARRALAGAVAVQRGLAERRFDLPGVKVRIGINTGEVVVQGGDLYGQTVHAAARIADKAHGGEILVSEVVRQLVGNSPETTFVDRGRYRLKGFPERFHLFEVVWGGEEAPPPAPFVARTPYVGRETERAELTRRLESALASQGGLVLIGGEPGVGKTRLTEEVGTIAAGQGFRVLIGRCYEIEGAPPYVPFVEILDQALAAAPNPEAYRALLGDDAPEVAKLQPRLRRLFRDIPQPLELPPEQERYYLFNSLRDVLARAAAARPQFLVLDDLHWADEGTLLLVEHLAGHLPRLAVLAVGTYRDTEVSPEHRLARPLENLLRQRLACRVSLHRLPEEGVAALLQALSGQEPPPSLVAAVHAETQGNPFFTEEIFKHLAEEGRLFGEDGYFRPEVVIGELDVPETLRLVLGRRLERLGPNGRRALAAAAVVGRAFTYELLEALEELPPDALLDALDEAERARLVSPLSNAADEDRLLFSHELIRQTLLTELSQPRRRRLHLRVADTLERLFADRLDDHASEIAHHLIQAGSAADRHRLLRSLTLAGRQAMRTAGYEDALRYFEQALSLIDVSDPAERPALFADRALARRSLGRYEDALPDWEQAFRMYEELGDVKGAAQMSFEASFELWWLNRDREALAWAERGLTALGDRETPQRAQMLGWAGVAGAYISPFECGAEKIDAALALAKRLGEKRLVGYGLVSRALHHFAFVLHRVVLESGQEGTDLLRAEGDLWEVATLLGFMELSALELGLMNRSFTIGEEAHSLSTRLGHSFVLFVLHGLAVSARQLVTDPDLPDYEAFAQRHFEVVGSVGFRHFSGTLLSHSAFLRGDWEQALHWAKDAAEHSPEGHGTSGMDWAAYLRMLAYSGRPSEVLNILERKQSDFPEPGRPNPFGSWYLPAAAIEALSVIGERERAAAYYPVVTEYITATGVVLSAFSPTLAQRIAGIGAAAARQWDAAEDHFRTALRQAEQLPFAIEGSETRRWYAWMLLDRNAAGDSARARSLVDEAIPVYRRIGMPRHEELARALFPA